jgi:hypothetical protein
MSSPGVRNRRTKKDQNHFNCSLLLLLKKDYLFACHLGTVVSSRKYGILFSNMSTNSNEKNTNNNNHGIDAATVAAPAGLAAPPSPASSTASSDSSIIPYFLLPDTLDLPTVASLQAELTNALNKLEKTDEKRRKYKNEANAANEVLQEAKSQRNSPSPEFESLLSQYTTQ